MRHDPVRLARKCRDQGGKIGDREAAALLRGMADDLDALAGKLALIRHSATRTPVSVRRRTLRTVRRS